MLLFESVCSYTILYVPVLSLLTVFSIIIGSVSKSNIIWNFIDLFVGILAIINIYALIKLKKEIIGFK